MVPEGWHIKTVGDLFDVQLGKMLNKEAKEKQSQFEYLGNSNVRWGSFNFSNLKTMHFNEKERLKFSLRKGDVVLCEGGEVGRCAIWCEEKQDVYFQKALHRLRSNGKILPEYFQNYMEKIAGTKLLEDFTSRTSIAHLTREKLVELPIKTPPVSEQKKITEILSTWDKAITTTEQLLANSQQHKKALMQQLLTGKKRFQGFDTEWRDVKLNDICEINPAKPIKPADGKVSFIPMDAVTEDAKLVKFDERDYSEVEKGFTSFQNEDVLIAKITPCFENGKGCFSENLVNGIGFGSTEFHVLRAKEKISSWYIYFTTNTSEFRLRGEMNMQGSAGQKRVTTDYVKAYKLSFPPSYEEQEKIAVMLRISDSEIDTLQDKIDLLKKEKKALMQQLLTGKRRVEVEAT